MDISTPAPVPIPASELPGAVVAAPEAAGPERSFAAVLADGPTLEPSAASNRGRAPVTSPILEVDDPVAPLRALERQLRATRVAPTRPSLEMLGEQAGRPPGGMVSSEAAGGAVSWQRLADNVMVAEGRIDSMIEAGRNGKAFTASELIGLQMEVFRYSQTVEVISRTTDKVVGAFKQVLGTQV